MNKKLLKFATSTVLGLAMALSVAQAQDQQAGPPAGRRGPMDPEAQIQHMRDQLKLTDDQVNQIRPILADSQKQMMTLRNDSTLSQDDRRAKFMSIRQESLAKVRAILNDDQKTQYDAMIAKQREQRRQMQQSAPPDANPNQ